MTISLQLRVVLIREQGVFVCGGWYENSHRLMNYYLYAQIFMYSMHKMLVDLFFKQILNLFPITFNYYKIVTESFNRDSLFFPQYLLFLSVHKQSPSMDICWKTVYNLPSTFSKSLIKQDS